MNDFLGGRKDLDQVDSAVHALPRHTAQGAMARQHGMSRVCTGQASAFGSCA